MWSLPEAPALPESRGHGAGQPNAPRTELPGTPAESPGAESRPSAASRAGSEEVWAVLSPEPGFSHCSQRPAQKGRQCCRSTLTLAPCVPLATHWRLLSPPLQARSPAATRRVPPRSSPGTAGGAGSGASSGHRARAGCCHAPPVGLVWIVQRWFGSVPACLSFASNPGCGSVKRSERF